MMVGLFEPRAAPWKVDGIPERLLVRRRSRPTGTGWRRSSRPRWRGCPVTLEAGVRTFFCGPESFTPDLSPVVGEAPELRGYFVAAGMNSVGILTAGGLGRVLAHWIVDRPPRRRRDRRSTSTASTPYQARTRSTARTRTIEILGTVYAGHTRAGRCAPPAAPRLSPVHDRLVAARRATSRTSAAGRAPTGIAGPGVEPTVEPPTWGRPPWFEQWAAEHRGRPRGRRA